MSGDWKGKVILFLSKQDKDNLLSCWLSMDTQSCPHLHKHSHLKTLLYVFKTLVVVLQTEMTRCTKVSSSLRKHDV